jgi:hypothetical protein
MNMNLEYLTDKVKSRHVNRLYRWQFRLIPRLTTTQAEVECSSFVILPSRRMHDSGYRCMGFVLVDPEARPMGLVSGYSDVIHFDGIGGFGYRWLERFGRCPDVLPPIEWTIDCLPRSGLLRVFCRSQKGQTIIAETCSLSSFEVYAKR